MFYNVLTRNKNVCSAKLPYILMRKEENLMDNMIKGYIQSCELVGKRLDELRAQYHQLEEQGDILAIKELDLDRRIKLLYKEREHMQEIITTLENYVRRTGKRGNT